MATAGLILLVVGVGVDLELAADLGAGGVEPLAVHAPIVAVLGVALPDDDEIAVGVHGDVGVLLPVRQGRVDEELVALAVPCTLKRRA